MTICPMCNKKIMVLYQIHLRNCTKEYIRKYGVNATMQKARQIENDLIKRGKLTKYKRIK